MLEPTHPRHLIARNRADLALTDGLRHFLKVEQALLLIQCGVSTPASQDLAVDHPVAPVGEAANGWSWPPNPWRGCQA